MKCDMPGCSEVARGEGLWCAIHELPDHQAQAAELAIKNARAKAAGKLSWDENRERR